jgi:hypothetical protein
MESLSPIVGVALSVLGTALVSGQQPVAQFLVPETECRLEADLAGKRVPVWSGRALVVLDDSPAAAAAKISSYDRQGRQLGTVLFTIPGAQHISVRSVSRGVDGTIALCGGAVDGAGRVGSFVGWVSPDGTDTHIVRTSPYVPWRITVAADGTFWTQGSETIPRAPGQTPAARLADRLVPGAAVFRRFDRSGRLMAGFVPQSEIREPLALWPVGGVFGSAGDRVIWYSGRQYFEISPKGVMAAFSDLPLPDDEAENGFAITDQGELFIGSVGKHGWRISRLDPHLPAWVTVLQSPFDESVRRAPWLYGAEENTLVASGDNTHLKFFGIRR